MKPFAFSYQKKLNGAVIVAFVFAPSEEEATMMFSQKYPDTIIRDTQEVDSKEGVNYEAVATEALISDDWDVDFHKINDNEFSV